MSEHVELARIPKLTVTKGEDGSIWIGDENKHTVAMFCVKTRESHMVGSQMNSMNYSLNCELADHLIAALQKRWRSGKV